MKNDLKHLTIILLVLVYLVETANAFYDPSLQRWINRDPIKEQGGINLYTFVRNNAIGLLDSLGLAHFNCKETENLLEQVRSEGLIEGYFNHSGGGAYDFKVNQPNDTFEVDGNIMTADQFGNYAAGYGAQHAGGGLGYAGVRAGGIYYDFMDNVVGARGSRAARRASCNNFDWDADSVADIRAGADRASREQTPPPPILPWPGNGCSNCSVNTPPIVVR